jgi:alpha-tubulin suppressor-like RCC1 family protein
VTTAAGAQCWGDNSFGQLGDGTTTLRAMPTAISIAGDGTVATGADHTCLLTPTGDVFCWGDNGRGQLGVGTFSRALTPVGVTFP